MMIRLAVTTGVLSAGVLVMLFFGVLRPLSEIKTLNLAIAQDRTNLEFRYANRQVLRKILADLESLSDELPVLRAVYLNEGSELEFVQQIEAAAQTLSLEHRLSLTQPPETTPATYARRLGVDIRIKGPFRSLARFIEELERLPLVTLDPALLITHQRDTGTVEAAYHVAVPWPRISHPQSLIPNP